MRTFAGTLATLAALAGFVLVVVLAGFPPATFMGCAFQSLECQCT
jgi:hypothetical protein